MFFHPHLDTAASWKPGFLGRFLAYTLVGFPKWYLMAEILRKQHLRLVVSPINQSVFSKCVLSVRIFWGCNRSSSKLGRKLLLMEETAPFEVGSLSQYLRRVLAPSRRWLKIAGFLVAINYVVKHLQKTRRG